MGNIVEFPTTDGRGVLVETSDGYGTPVTRGGHQGSVVQEAQRTFEEAVGHIQPAVQVLIDQLVSLAHRPSAVCVEFGVDLHAEAGAFIAKTGGTANFMVRLTWEDTRTD
ncbi:CU044_2847 family protein [Kocuria nitroreducens]|uniref:CU044_2847 family protein n=1 Tax=Kocuria nitroreducens TaxID=3058914 RepID=UPI0036DABC76